ncbi:hypothetical protein HHL21_12300 [Massilia sp. RP-1-19]|uniref:Enoyl-CoA hydratase n=1 Tax=Massilia polaris TaxID=2728846 RepID=A0A848HKZ9_9BURK|nr:hypothetical protein [Massilia polaris]NML61842.1 hypothetical protein [Massilia polaris]
MTFRAAFYRGTRPGVAGIYNRLVRWWTRSEYSHVELVFSTGHSASASFEDKGVRFKVIDFDPAHWDFIDLPRHLEARAFLWFEKHRGLKYDSLGNLHFIVSPVGHDKRRWFCSEAVAAALGIPDPWRYTPATLASTLRALTKPASAGFSL